jgi:hypothetical protein
LKEIYHTNEDNPIVNFFLAYNYLALLKYEKSKCFFDKLLQIYIKHSYENFSFLKKLLNKAKLIIKKLPSLDQSVNETYIDDLLSFIDFPYINEVEEYEDVLDESLQNKMNTDLNIVLRQTERTKRIPAENVVKSYNDMKKNKSVSTLYLNKSKYKNEK